MAERASLLARVMSDLSFSVLGDAAAIVDSVERVGQSVGKRYRQYCSRGYTT